MTNVFVNLPGAQYDVLIEHGLRKAFARALFDLHPHHRCAVLADEVPFQIHGAEIVAELTSAGYAVTTGTFTGGEEHKNVSTVSRLYDVLLDAGLERRSPIVALGGGIAGDVVGFVAATYLRGVPLIQFPTTLLAMVDSSVGGKVGYNHPKGKNMIGAFYQPSRVIVDPEVLNTLPRREFLCGLAECIKHGVLGDAQLFDWIAKHIDDVLALRPETIVELLRRNIEFKANIVAQDEKESGLRSLLNLGHTFAHAIEAATHYDGSFLHGEAVALGVVAACNLASDRGMFSRESSTLVRELFAKVGLPTRTELPETRTLVATMRRDKKVEGDKLRLILPTAMGASAIFDDISEDQISQAWDSIRC